MSKAEVEKQPSVNARHPSALTPSSLNTPALKVAAASRTELATSTDETRAWKDGKGCCLLPRAVFVSYMSGGLIHVGLDNDCAFVFPAYRVEALAASRAIDLRLVWIESFGRVLHWPRLQTRLALSRLMQGEFGTPEWMSLQSSLRACPSGQLAAARRKNRASLQSVPASA